MSRILLISITVYTLMVSSLKASSVYSISLYLHWFIFYLFEGYGDVTPKSPMGYFIGSVCVVTGILVIAFTVPVVVNNFTLYYTLCKSRNSRLHMIRHMENEQKRKNSKSGVAKKSKNHNIGGNTPRKSVMNSIDVQSITWEPMILQRLSKSRKKVTWEMVWLKYVVYPWYKGPSLNQHIVLLYSIRKIDDLCTVSFRQTQKS